KHVTGTQFEPTASSGWMKAGDRERASGLHLAGNVRFIERTFGFQGNKACLGVVFVASLDGSLHRPQFSSIHIQAPFHLANRHSGGRSTSCQNIKSPELTPTNLFSRRNPWRFETRLPPKRLAGADLDFRATRRRCQV